MLVPLNKDFKEPKDGGVDVYIQTNGVHTDIVFPVVCHVHSWEKWFPFHHFSKVDTSCHFVAIGWGDKGFFMDTPTWADLKFSTAFKAAFFLSSSAMHVTYQHKPVEGENCKRRRFSEAQYLRLTAAVEASFAKDAAQHIQHIQHAGYGQHDTFYEALGTYSFLNTCNVWTGNMLNKGGARVSCWTPFDYSVFYYLK